MGVKLRSIQVLRGVAAMGVVAHHAFPGSLRIGSAGVDLFFVISGFIMATCAVDRQPIEFLADRAWRIYPLWLIAVTPWLLMAPHTPLEILRSVTLWPVWQGQFLNPALGVGWTLSFELLFYLGFALALKTRPSVSLIAYGVCLIMAFSSPNVLFGFAGSPLTFEFLMGIGIAQLPRNARLGTGAIGAGLLWFVLAPATYYNQAFGLGAVLRVVAWGVPAAMILYGAWALEDKFGSRAFDLPVLIGSASYSIYLFHQLVFLQLHGTGGLILSAVAGILAYWVIERGIMRARPGWSRLRPRAVRPRAVASA